MYADLVKESAGKLREALGLHPEDEVKEDMLDIVDSKIVVHGGDPVLFDVAVVADTAFYSLDKSIHLTAEAYAPVSNGVRSVSWVDTINTLSKEMPVVSEAIWLNTVSAP